jgi:hypothetical protein
VTKDGDEKMMMMMMMMMVKMVKMVIKDGDVEKDVDDEEEEEDCDDDFGGIRFGVEVGIVATTNPPQAPDSRAIRS